MAVIEIDGKLVEVPDNLSPEEMDQIANDIAGPAPAASKRPGLMSLSMAGAQALKEKVPFPNIIGGNRATEIVKKPGRMLQAGVEKLAGMIPDPQRQSVAANVALGTPKALMEMAAPMVGAAIDPQDMAIGLGMGNLMVPAAGKALKSAGAYVEEKGVGAGRRALGATKMHLHSTKSPFESLRKQAVANKTAREMLERDLISKTGSAETTAENAMDLMASGRDLMRKALETVDNAPLPPGKDLVPYGTTPPAPKAGWKVDTDAMIDQLRKKVKPKFDDELRAFKEVVSDVRKYGKELSASEAKKVLKARWAKKGYEDRTVGTVASNVYRKVADETERQIGAMVSEVDQAAGRAYKEGNRAFAAGMNSLKYLGNELAKDMGNNASSLGSQILATGQLATGNLGGAAATIGLTEMAKRRGMGVGANVLFRGGRRMIEAGEGIARSKALKVAAAMGAALEARRQRQKEKEKKNG